MSVSYPCPSCGQLLSLPHRTVEQKARCPACGALFTAPPTAPLRDGPPEPLPESLPGRGLTNALVALLALHIGVLTAYALFVVLARSGSAPTLSRINRDPVLVLSGCASLLIFSLTAILFLVWMARSYGNLVRMGVSGLRYSPGWAVGSFFIPVMNLYLPFLIAEEMWRASNPKGGRIDWRKSPASALLTGWWVFWILYLLCRLVVAYSLFANRLRGDELEIVVLGLFGDGMFCLSELCALMMIRGLRQRQEEKLGLLLDQQDSLPSSSDSGPPQPVQDSG